MVDARDLKSCGGNTVPVQVRPPAHSAMLISTPRFELNCEIAGNGPPLVLFHGFGVGPKWMDRYVERFQKTHKVYAFDMPYSGTSRFFLPHSVESYARAMKTVLEELGVESPVVIGESLGGSVALVLSGIFNVKALVLVSPILKFKGSFIKNLLQIALPTMNYIAKATAKRMFPDDLLGQDKAKQAFMGNPKPLLLKSFLALARFDGFKHLGTVKAPALAIGGKFDKVARADLLEDACETLGCKCHIENEAGHQVAITKWPEVCEVIKIFLELHAP